MSLKDREDLLLLPGTDDDIMINIRHIDISGLESPYMTANLHFSGQCAFRCPDCHSSALNKVEPGDKQSLSSVLAKIKEFQEASLIHGVCIMGTDSEEKRSAVERIIRFALCNDLVSVVYTGYDLYPAIWNYGPANWFVCGRYLGGEWHEHKEFYERVDLGKRFYDQRTMEAYFAAWKNALPSEII
jgi:hypothetical protein